MEFARDTLPPATVITHARRAGGGALVVRGTTSENETVRAVLVNGRPAKALAENFAEWEVALDGLPGGEVTLTAHAVDVSGNVEPWPHRLLVRLPRGSGRDPAQAGGTLALRNLPAENRGENAATPAPGGRPAGGPHQAKANRHGSAAEALQGTWQMVSQQRAGRVTARPTNMRWVIQGRTIWLVVDREADGPPAGKGVPEKRPAPGGPGGKQPAPRGGLRMTFGLDPAGATKRIDIDGPRKSLSYGIYRLDGDELTVCMGVSQPSPSYDTQARGDEKTRPAAISPEAGTVIVLKRLRD
jgi:uncharacterized protein (TIGR03067 family)